MRHFEHIRDLWSFFILDRARVRARFRLIRALPGEKRSLYRSVGTGDLDEVSPYLFECGEDAAVGAYIIENGWGDSWGVFLSSSASMSEVYNHLRKFLLVNDEDGNELYFRFYDPRVLRVFLPTCTTGQLEEFFGPIDAFFLEDENPDRALVFCLVDRKLVREIIDLTTTREEQVAVPRRSTPSLDVEDNIV